MIVEHENPDAWASAHDGAHDGESHANIALEVEFPDPWVFEPIPPEILDAPLDYLFADHHRQRQAALALLLVADGEFDRNGLGDLIDFLEVDFALHVDDEERGFFPILRQHCAPQDNIDALIDRLIDEHNNDDRISAEIMRVLNDLSEGKPLEESDKSKLRAFAEHIRQHLAVENAVLLPIARVRLDENAQSKLSAILKQHHAGTGD